MRINGDDDFSVGVREAEKRNQFSFMNKLFDTQRNLTKFGTVIVSEYYHRCYLLSFWNLL